MKIENEITGEIDEVKESYVGIRLHICSFDILDYFAVDIEEKEIITKLNTITKILLKTEHTFEDYMQLIKDLGLEMPSKWKKHWIPAEEWSYYSIDQGGNVESLKSYGELSSARFRKENYNASPTRELAEKACNVSKLGRLILLWQYANECVFTPDWSSDDRAKYHVMYDNVDKKVSCNYNNNLQSDTVYFKTEEQARAFVKMYEKEIKEIMGISQC